MPPEQAKVDTVRGPKLRRCWRTAWAGLLSLLLPGLGQIYVQRYRFAAGFCAVSFGCALLLGSSTALDRWLPSLAASPDLLLVALVLLGANLVNRLASAIHAAVVSWGASRWPRRGWRRSTWIWGAVFLLAGGALSALLPKPPFGSYGMGQSAAMQPGLDPSDYFVATRSRSALAQIAPGDIIAFSLSDDRTVTYVKRVVALSGQTVQMRGGRLVVDGVEVPRQDLGLDPSGMHRWRLTLANGRSFVVLKEAEEPQAGDDTNLFEIGPGEFFVLGDNLDHSQDSRSYWRIGPVTSDLLLGRADWIIWSSDPHRIGRVH